MTEQTGQKEIAEYALIVYRTTKMHSITVCEVVVYMPGEEERVVSRVEQVPSGTDDPDSVDVPDGMVDFVKQVNKSISEGWRPLGAPITNTKDWIEVTSVIRIGPALIQALQR